MTPAPKRPRLTREEAILALWWHAKRNTAPGSLLCRALNYAIRALKREQKAAKTKKKETKR